LTSLSIRYLLPNFDCYSAFNTDNHIQKKVLKMKCPKCQFENPETIQFCGKCGAKLENICPQCNSSNPSDFKFCGKCGHDLTQPKEALAVDYSEPQSYTPKFLADKILTTRSSIEGERKLVTVLFADVADYTSMAEKLDPEEVHQIMDGCFNILMNEIHKYEGPCSESLSRGLVDSESHWRIWRKDRKGLWS
jgi:ribosomal protein L40E